MMPRPSNQPQNTVVFDPDGDTMKLDFAKLTAFLAANSTGTGVLICPGGGYSHVSIVKEGYNPAAYLNNLGIDAWVLDYTTTLNATAPIYPKPEREVFAALKKIRHENPNIEKLGIWGFSAGGHLASTTLTNPKAGLDFGILAYPVITLEGNYTHVGSRDNLVGPNASAEELHGLSAQNLVSDTTPPTFLFHTSDDQAVPVQNTLMFAEAMAAHKRKAQVLILPDGPHGLGLALEDPVANELRASLSDNIDENPDSICTNSAQYSSACSRIGVTSKTVNGPRVTVVSKIVHVKVPRASTIKTTVTTTWITQTVKTTVVLKTYSTEEVTKTIDVVTDDVTIATKTVTETTTKTETAEPLQTVQLLAIGSNDPALALSGSLGFNSLEQSQGTTFYVDFNSDASTVQQYTIHKGTGEVKALNAPGSAAGQSASYNFSPGSGNPYGAVMIQGKGAPPLVCKVADGAGYQYLQCKSQSSQIADF
ncbi:MCH2 (monocarboxylate permease) [Fusarium mundagurra]|uniref:MCH2 (Monocarboxylate permease) n=1 Tax=Fusarium mundagurra TaxID=1567541 RepID=A0A8H6DCH5_9HYPO|nr:MCH2 (monocarboxylate permease) [Fusarium mundagurra]